MKIKRIFIALIIGVLAVSVSAQDGEKGISVLSSPAGAEVFLEGDLSVAGLAPVTFYQNLMGEYKLVIKKEGYETYKSNISFSPISNRNFNISLKPKTQFKALARSILIPGWGQSYIDKDFKASLFFISAIVSSVAFVNREANFRDKRDEYTDLMTEYIDADGNYDERSRIYPLLQSARKSAFDAESQKRISMGVMAGVWAVNLLDLMFHFPNYGSDTTVNSLTLKPNKNQDGGQIVLTHRF